MWFLILTDGRFKRRFLQKMINSVNTHDLKCIKHVPNTVKSDNIIKQSVVKIVINDRVCVEGARTRNVIL